MLGCGVACYGDDTDVEEVDEEFVRCYFLGFFGAPEEALVEVLPHDGTLVEPHCLAEFALCAPGVFVKHGIAG